MSTTARSARRRVVPDDRRPPPPASRGPVMATTVPARSLLAPAPTCAVPPVPDPAEPVQWRALAGFVVLGAALTTYVGLSHGARQAVLLALGVGLGLALFHSQLRLH